MSIARSTARRPVPLIRAVTDPKLLGTVTLPGHDKPTGLFPSQVELLRDVERDARLLIYCMGRRSGKTMMAALVALWSCLLRPDLDALVRPGERRYAVCVATSREQARILVDAARSLVEASPLLRSALEGTDTDELRFRLPDGSRTALRAMPCSGRAVRGLPVSVVIFDEIAHFLSETEGPAVADRVYEALVPATAQFGDLARVLLISTPWGTDGLFAREFHRAQSGELAGAIARQASTAQMNPTITAEFLAAEEARDPESFQGEYMAAFLQSGAAYLDFDRFEMADHAGLPPEAGTGWIAGLDPAFAGSDPFGVAVVGRSVEDRNRLVLGHVAGLKPRRSYSQEERSAVTEELLEHVSDVCRRYNARAVSDQYLAKIVADRLSRDGVTVRQHSMTSSTKTAIFSELRARLYGGTLEIFDDPQLVAELRRLRTKFTAGSAAIVNPRVGGSHGDMAQALALAVFEHRYGISTGSPRTGRSRGDRGPEGFVARLSPTSGDA